MIKKIRDIHHHRVDSVATGEEALSDKTIVETLEKIRELNGFSKPQLIRIAKLPVSDWGPTELIINEGGENIDQMIILLAGRVYIRKRVIKDDKETFEQVAEISGPAVIGENAFFTGLNRSAAVYAKEKVVGIVIRREDFNRLISLDKASFIKFLRQISEENLQRAERTLVLYMNTLQLVLSVAAMSKCPFTKSMDNLRWSLNTKNGDMDHWQSLAREVMLFIRELNQALEELYEFANLPEIYMLFVDMQKFRYPSNAKHYDIFLAFAEDMDRSQKLVNLKTLNFKDALLTTVVSIHDRGLVMVDYPKIISIAAEAYMDFARNYRLAGFEAVVNTPKVDVKDKKYHKIITDLLWEDF